MDMDARHIPLEQLQKWWNRIQEIPPWGWKQDPYLSGITEEVFIYLRDLDTAPESQIVEK